jgi:hypothetical protein
MQGSSSKILSKKSRPCIYDVKFLALLGASYIYTHDISRLRVKTYVVTEPPVSFSAVNWFEGIATGVINLIYALYSLT